MKKTDLTYLINVAGGNHELILEIIDIFVIQAEEFWNEMQDLYNNKDYDALGKLAHKAKSSVAIMGMDALAIELKNLELLCNEGKQIELYQDIISNFKAECLIVIEELLEYKNNQFAKKTSSHVEH